MRVNIRGLLNDWLVLKKMRTVYLQIFVCLLALSSPAQAEVMDKEPTLLTNLIWGFAGAVLCFLSARYKPRLLWLPGAIAAFYFYGLIEEILDPYVGRDIVIEAGKIYVVVSYLLVLLIIVSIVAGFIMRRIKRKDIKPST